MESMALLARKTSPLGNMNTVSEARWEGEFRDASWRSTTSGEEEEKGKKQGTLIGRKLLMEKHSCDGAP